MSTTPKAGYVVSPRGVPPRLFSCSTCRSGGYDCEYFTEALRFARSNVGGATITRGDVVLATPGGVLDAKARATERARRRREREERALGGSPDLPRASEGPTATDTAFQAEQSSSAA